MLYNSVRQQCTNVQCMGLRKKKNEEKLSVDCTRTDRPNCMTTVKLQIQVIGLAYSTFMFLESSLYAL